MAVKTMSTLMLDYKRDSTLLIVSRVMRFTGGTGIAKEELKATRFFLTAQTGMFICRTRKELKLPLTLEVDS